MKTKQIRAILAAITCSAGISQAAVIPYSSDANTLHLWHLDGTANPLSDSAGSLKLYNWGTWGTFAVDSASGLNQAYESSTAENSNIQDNSNLGLLSWTNELMGADGAFTWEMVLRPDEADDSGVGTQMLMHHSLNQMQLKLNYDSSGDLFLTMWDGVNSVVLFNEPLDSGLLGINQYATNEWFHLAVTYDGTSAGKVYWTKLGDYNGTANELASFSMSDLTLFDATLAFGGNANLGGNVFNGALDEIRISDIARASDAFLVPAPDTLGLIASSGLLNLGIRQVEAGSKASEISPWKKPAAQPHAERTRTCRLEGSRRNLKHSCDCT